MKKKRSFSLMTLCLRFCFLIGCSLVVSEVIAGQNGVNELGELPDPLAARKYESENSSRTITLPVVLDMPDTDMFFSVTGVNIFGSPVNKGIFKGGKIVAREFRKAIAANFHIVEGDEVPVAKIVVHINRIAVKILSRDITEATLQIHVDVMKNGGSASAYSKEISASWKEKWISDKEIPSAFYAAVGTFVANFIKDWDSSGAVSTVIAWNDLANPGVVTPELKPIQWEKKGDAWLGRCEVQCNDYKSDKALVWANARIKAACQTKLGDMDSGRFRIYYDKEQFDENTRIWTFEFRTLVLKWNDSVTQGIMPPELKAFEWEKKGDIWHGRCEIQCNEYEDFQAMSWANAQIATASRIKLGNISPERVRILYDKEDFDKNNRKWTFEFRTFGSSPMVLSFSKRDANGQVNSGQVIGDLDLMNLDNDSEKDVEKAVEKLKNYVLSQMQSFVGAVSIDAQKGKALVRFDDFKMDSTYNLITIKFRLVGLGH